MEGGYMRDRTLRQVVWLSVIGISITFWYYIVKLIKYLYNLLKGLG